MNIKLINTGLIALFLIILLVALSNLVFAASVSIEGYKVIINTTYQETGLDLIETYPFLIKENATFLLRTSKRSVEIGNVTGTVFISVPYRPLESGTYAYIIKVRDAAGNTRNDTATFELINPYNLSDINELCYNGQKNDNESDVDCGGVCLPCGDGKKCLVDNDCLSGYCKNNVCTAPSCTDGIKNGLESDVDCGGECPGCDLDKSCNKDTDCSSNFCNPNTKKCSSYACDDGYKNGDESDVDCGGGCPAKCSVGQSCFSDNDCESGYCETGLCAVDKNKDSDGDGIPDWWENKYGLDPNDPYDADEDNDGDKLSNLDEYFDGTDPTDPNDPLRAKSHVFQIILLILGLLLMVGSTAFLVYSRKVLLPQQRSRAKQATPMKLTPQAQARPGLRRPGQPMLKPGLRRPLGRRQIPRRSARKALLGRFGAGTRVKAGVRPVAPVRTKKPGLQGAKQAQGFVPLSELKKKLGRQEKDKPSPKKPLSGAFDKLKQLSEDYKQKSDKKKPQKK